jgi:WD40 repeat protein
LRGHTDAVTSAEFSRDGRILTTSFDGSARLWDAQGRSLQVLTGHNGWVWRGHFDQSGRLVATASIDGTARIWDAATGAEVSKLSGGAGSVQEATFDSSGARVATAHIDGVARMWSVNGTLLRELVGHVRDRAIRSVTFSPDGAFLATASDDSTIRVWNTVDSNVAAILVGHQGEVLSAAFNMDGRRLATVSIDASARVWDVQSSRLIASIPVETASTPFLSFSYGNKLLTLSGSDALLVPLFGSAADAMAFARTAAPRELTESERQSLFLLPKGAEACTP